MLILMISVAEFFDKAKLIILLLETATRDNGRVFRTVGKNMKLQIRVTNPLRRFVPGCENLILFKYLPPR